MVTCEDVGRWQAGVEAFDRGDLNQAQCIFTDIKHISAYMSFNLSTVFMLSGDLATADEKLRECTERDRYLAVAYFQRGVVACLQGRLLDGQSMFQKTLDNIRGGPHVDYNQLGLAVCLYKKQVEKNLSVVQSAITSCGPTTPLRDGELETLPLCVFRPSRSKVDNLTKRQFLQASQVVYMVPGMELQPGTSVQRTERQSSSAPASPSARHRLSVESLTVSKPPHTPPPSRPPPRCPPTARVVSTTSVREWNGRTTCSQQSKSVADKPLPSATGRMTTRSGVTTQHSTLTQPHSDRPLPTAVINTSVVTAGHSSAQTHGVNTGPQCRSGQITGDGGRAVSVRGLSAAFEKGCVQSAKEGSRSLVGPNAGNTKSKPARPPPPTGKNI